MRLTAPASLLAALALGGAVLAGCGGSDDQATPTTPTPPAAEALKVGLIVDHGQLDDNGFNELAFKGLKRAEEDLGVEGRVVESASRGRLHPEHELARARRLRPDHRGRLRAGRRDRQGREALSEDEVRDHRRLPGRRARQAEERPGPALPRGGGRLPRRLPRRAAGEGTRRARTRSRRSAGSRSRRSTASSPATGPAPRRRRRGSRFAGTTRRTGTTRPSARSWRSTRSQPARVSSSRSPAAAGSAR